MALSKQTLMVFQNLLAIHKVSVLDPNADSDYTMLAQARGEVQKELQAIQEAENTKAG